MILLSNMSHICTQENTYHIFFYLVLDITKNCPGGQLSGRGNLYYLVKNSYLNTVMPWMSVMPSRQTVLVSIVTMSTPHDAHCTLLKVVSSCSNRWCSVIIDLN